MRVTWEKISLHVGVAYGPDIGNELTNKEKLVIPEPKHSDEVLAVHEEQEELRKRNITTHPERRP